MLEPLRTPDAASEEMRAAARLGDMHLRAIRSDAASRSEDACSRTFAEGAWAPCWDAGVAVAMRGGVSGKRAARPEKTAAPPPAPPEVVPASFMQQTRVRLADRVSPGGP